MRLIGDFNTIVLAALTEKGTVYTWGIGPGIGIDPASSMPYPLPFLLSPALVFSSLLYIPPSSLYHKSNNFP